MDKDQEKKDVLDSSDTDTNAGANINTNTNANANVENPDKAVEAKDARLSEKVEKVQTNVDTQQHKPSEDSGAQEDTLGNAGVLLRSLRMEANVHIETLAAGLKVSPRKIEALEAERWEELPDLVFARGMAASFCRYLRVDRATVQAVLSRMPKLEQVGGADLVSIPPKKHIKMPEDTENASLLKALSWKHLLILLIILLLILMVYFFPGKNVDVNWLDEVMPSGTVPVSTLDKQKTSTPGITSTGENNNTQTQSAATTAPEVSEVAGATVGIPSAQALKESTAAKAAATQFVTQAETRLVPPDPQAQVDIQTYEVIVEEDAVTNDVQLVSAVLLFRAIDEESWIQVTEVNTPPGEEPRQYESLLQPGESTVLPEDFSFPVKVVVGNVGGTQVVVRDEIFDLNAVARGNVARFEVQ